MKTCLLHVPLLLILSCSSKEITSDKLNGTWLHKALIDTLISTKSMLKASGAANASYLVIKNGRINVWEGFHSTSGNDIEKLCLTNEPFTYIVKGDSKDTVIIQDKDSCNRIMLSFYDHGVYIRLNEPVDYFINKIVLAGRYSDKTGDNYYFNSDGITNWPSSGYMYEIIKDYWMIQKDCIAFKDTVNQKSVYYGYSWNENVLRFHKPIDFTDSTNIPDEYMDFQTPSCIEFVKKQ